MKGAAIFTARFRAMEAERTIIELTPIAIVLALASIMGFRSMQVPVTPPPVPHPVHISLVRHDHVPGEGGGGRALAETAKAGQRTAHNSSARTRAPLIQTHAAEQAPAPLVAEPLDIVGGADDTANDDGAEGDDTSGDAGSSSGGGSGSGSGLGLGMGDGAQPPPIDKSRRPEPFAKEWSCDWPVFGSVKDATVFVRVTVSQYGRATTVEVVGSTHREFEDVAAQCAMHAGYHAGRDENGSPAVMETKELPIHFIKYVAGEDE